MTAPSRIHRPQQPTETSREYSLAVSLQVAEQRIATDQEKIDRLRQEAALQSNVIRDLRQQLRQYETHAARLTLENARLTFAIEAAAWVVEDLKRLVPEDEECDRSELEVGADGAEVQEVL